jgi:hypothetical protein
MCGDDKVVGESVMVVVVMFNNDSLIHSPTPSRCAPARAPYAGTRFRVANQLSANGKLPNLVKVKVSAGSGWREFK